jgi:hypothetical protein
MDYVKSAGGIEQNADYPYSSYYGVTGTCSADASKNVIQVTDYTVITGSSIESSMASHVQSTGPLSICVDASSWSSYTGGVMKVCGKSIDHAGIFLFLSPLTTTQYSLLNFSQYKPSELTSVMDTGRSETHGAHHGVSLDISTFHTAVTLVI